MSGQGLTGAVGQLLAGLQVQPLNVIAVLGKGGQRRVSHCLYIEKNFKNIFTFPDPTGRKLLAGSEKNVSDPDLGTSAIRKPAKAP